MSHYINLTPRPCRDCGVPLVFLPGRYWPNRYSPIEATPLQLPEAAAITIEGTMWRVAAYDERVTLAMMGRLYRLHSPDECERR